MRTGASLLLLAGILIVRAPAAGPDVGPDPKEVQAVLEKGAAFLKKTQNPDGSFSPKRAGPGISALVATALLRNGYSTDEPTVAKTLGYLEKSVQKDGGIYNKFLANYTTCIALLAFKEANKDGKYDTIIKRAGEFLKGLQHGDGTDGQDWRA